MADDRRADGERTKPKREPTLAQRRLEWLAGICLLPKCAPAIVRAASAIAWKFSDKKTGETRVSAPTLAEFIKCSERAAAKAFSKLTAEGHLVVVEQSKRGKGVRRRIAFPPPPPKAPAKAVDVAQLPKSPREYFDYVLGWRERGDRDAIMTRWNSAAEVKLRAELCAGNQDAVWTCQGGLEKLRGDDEIPF
jgi:hypothetical protein